MTADERALVHRVLFYDREEEFLTTTAPFLREGLATDDVILAVAPPAKIDALRDTLGQDASSMRFIDATEFYRHPVRAIAAYSDLMRSHAPRRVRGIGELDWRGLTPLETAEWTRYESIVNAAFATSGVQAICSYDKRSAGPEALSAAVRTHSEVLGDHGSATGYTNPEVFNADLDRSPLPPPPPQAEFRLIEGEHLQDLRSFVAERADRHGMAREALGNLLMAVTEAATNAIKHGTPPASVRLWTAAGYLVCEITDHGHWEPGALLGLIPPATTPPRFGIWGMRMLTDIVQIRTGRPRTVIRLLSRLPT
ncbi:MAG: putative anti-sigma regulatory factor, serine/threonine protein kinase [Actinomycetia bacterium]|nr:putative anti-sigma regulatory factor, serine/threonine protein kinase [Actinomycetes bacterium]